MLDWALEASHEKKRGASRQPNSAPKC